MDHAKNTADLHQFPPQGVDLERPSVARIYDYLLGGDTNWAIDREFGDRLLEVMPLLRPIALTNRQFLTRAVRYLMRQGVRQFIDLGAGVPTMDHTHSVADAFEPEAARVVYVDHEPVAVALSQVLLEEQGDRTRHSAINGDIRAVTRLWRQIMETGLIDLSQPVALLMIAILHGQQLDKHGHDIGNQIVAQYRELLPAGSYLAISHATDDGVSPEAVEQLNQVKKLGEASGSPGIWRSHEEIASLFGDFELVEPGLTWTPLWHPEEGGSSGPDVTFRYPNESVVWAGIGRKTR
jgi:hypothetical protein